MIQSVFTSAREKLEKEGFGASSDSETEEESPCLSTSRRSMNDDGEGSIFQ